jgi:hypothetical protein
MNREAEDRFFGKTDEPEPSVEKPTIDIGLPSISAPITR